MVKILAVVSCPQWSQYFISWSLQNQGIHCPEPDANLAQQPPCDCSQCQSFPRRLKGKKPSLSTITERFAHLSVVTPESHLPLLCSLSAMLQTLLCLTWMSLPYTPLMPTESYQPFWDPSHQINTTKGNWEKRTISLFLGKRKLWRNPLFLPVAGLYEWSKVSVFLKCVLPLLPLLWL